MIKRLLIFFIFLISSAYSFYAEPPISAVDAQNRLKATELFDSFNENASQSTMVPVYWYSDSLPVNGSMKMAGLTAAVDNATNAKQNAGVIVQTGNQMAHLLQKSGTGMCDKTFFEIYGDAAECDFDLDSCSEYEYLADAFYAINITFIFRDKNETVAAEEESVVVFDKVFGNARTNVVSIPDRIREAMQNSSGNENLTLVLNGTATLVYEFDNRVPSGGPCTHGYSVISRKVKINGNASYRVEGENKLFFMTSPILNEQWFRNNRFDNVVLSQSKIYHANIMRNGIEAKNFTVCSFDTKKNSFGITEIVSVPMEDAGAFAGIVNVTPIQLEMKNQTYAFLYQFNYSYEGIGRNNFTIKVRDFFGGEENKTEKITSKELSYDSNKTETGDVYDPATARRSSSTSPETIRMIEVGLGMLGVLILIMLVYQIKK